MHKNNYFLAIAILFVSVPRCLPQVLAPPEIPDPAMRALQQQHMTELRAAAVDITSHQYPYKFYLSRALDLTEQQEQQSDQRSIRFSNFQGRTVLQVTGNYFAAYSDRTMNRNERVERTYLDVMLPILQATAARLGTEPQLNAFAIEISHHVRKQVLGVTMEHPENMALIVPRDVAGKLVASNNAAEQLAALRQSSLYVDGAAVSLWTQAENQPANVAMTAPPAPAIAPLPVAAPQRDLSPAALQQRLTQYQGAVDRIVHELDSQAHFVSYAPPALIAFHKASYLQLSFSTDLAASDAGSQYRIAALAFDRHVSHLIRPLLPLLPEGPEFDGIVFSSTVKIAGKDSVQSVEFFLSLADLRRYEQYDLTGQQLIGSGFVLINGERVDLELQRAEADIH